ncbi:uncharacterized protein LOC129583783 [Paramacrobiotus metropolitanus]|uniref:uncharacterized protein LOC129583783 n=1 Tax=Paramacrobiotus metropolitanus TaxID=2943436 RepID=UPI0024459C97|nr:uncharacterized protein LOC129583783 [Paramacrobiotus metropolitanus]
MGFLVLSGRIWLAAFDASLCSLWAVCKELVLVSYTASHPANNPTVLVTLIDNAAAWLKVTFRGHSEQSPSVCIPHLHFRSTDNPNELSRRFLTAVNDHCPEVAQHVYAKVTALHARWKETLAYPDEWVAFRSFLKIFSSFNPHHTSTWWEEADLRELDVFVLSRFALHFLDGCHTDEANDS